MLHQTITNMTDLNTIWIVDLEAVESHENLFLQAMAAERIE